MAIYLSGYNLSGRLTGIYDNGVVHYRYAKTKGRDLIRTWIYHLAYCHGNPPFGNGNSILICKDAIWKFDPVAEPLQVLKDLLDVYWQGLSEPIHFFPDSALAYIQKLQKNPDSQQSALAQAKGKWFGNDFAKGEGTDPYYQLSLGTDDPIDEKFQELALQILEPLIHHCQEIKI